MRSRLGEGRVFDDVLRAPKMVISRISIQRCGGRFSAQEEEAFERRTGVTSPAIPSGDEGRRGRPRWRRASRSVPKIWGFQGCLSTFR